MSAKTRSPSAVLRVEIYRERRRASGDQPWRWRARTGNHAIVAQSRRRYTSARNAERAFVEVFAIGRVEFRRVAR